MQKKIHKRDAIITIVLSLFWLLIFVTSYLLGNSQRAGENLTFAATLVSIVLAVLAIMITLVDASSQKQNVINLKEGVDKMERNLKYINNMSSSLDKHILESERLRDDMLKNFDNMYRRFDKLTKGSSDTVSKKELEEILKDVKYKSDYNEIKFTDGEKNTAYISGSSILGLLRKNLEPDNY